jgi:hypothetical protein
MFEARALAVGGSEWRSASQPRMRRWVHIALAVAHVEAHSAVRSAAGVVDIDVGAAGILVVACFAEASLDTHPSVTKLGT